VCDYRLSELVGGTGAVVAIGSAGTVAAGGAAFHAAGLYIIIHSASNMAMIGSVAAGASAAGTVGIIGGTAGILGTTAAIVSAPITILAGAGAAVGGTALELGCMPFVREYTEYEDTLELVNIIAQSMEPDFFAVVDPPSSQQRAYIRVLMDGERREFEVSSLYVESDELRNSDWGRNTRIGNIRVLLEEVATLSETVRTEGD